MSNSNIIKIIKNVPITALFAHEFKIVWINLNLKNCAHDSLSYISGMSTKISFLKLQQNAMDHPAVGRVQPTGSLRPSVCIHVRAVCVIIC